MPRSLTMRQLQPGTNFHNSISRRKTTQYRRADQSLASGVVPNMKTFGRPAPLRVCHAPNGSDVRAHGGRRRPLPPLAAATLEATPAQSAGSDTRASPSRAVVIGGSVAGLLTAAVASPFFDEASPCWPACPLVRRQS